MKGRDKNVDNDGCSENIPTDVDFQCDYTENECEKDCGFNI